MPIIPLYVSNQLVFKIGMRCALCEVEIAILRTLFERDSVWFKRQSTENKTFLKKKKFPEIYVMLQITTH